MLALVLFSGHALADEGLMVDAEIEYAASASSDSAMDLARRFYRQTLVSSAENFGQCLGGYAVPAQLQPPSHGSADTQDDPHDRLITAELDRLTGKRDGQIQLQGNVLIREGQRLLQAQSALLDQVGSEIRFPQGLLVTQSNLVVAGEQAKIGLL